METDETREIIKLMEENNICEFQLEREGFKISLKKAAPTAFVSRTADGEVMLTPAAAEPQEAEEIADETPAPDENVEIIPSPMVGTFYASPSPDSSPYVGVDQEIDKGDVVCIVEAMKVMNEIQSEVSGIIREILVENGEPVEFDQPLFRVEKAEQYV